MPNRDPAAGREARRPVVQLPPQLANQIAAGEVVARPASVVKELCENAIDAGATRIRVEIEGGGITAVRVIDDGHGMTEEDARLAMRRHATSKLRTFDDLRALETLGFRGEALPSIASVGRFTMKTRTRDAESGIELACDGGEAPEIRPCGCAPGTTVELLDLFFNVPARRKFLRAAATESAHVTEVVRDIALAHPEVGVELVRDGRRTKRWLPVPSRRERAAAALEGLELIPCVGERGPVTVEAYLSRPERARTGAGGLAIFVCGRPVRDRALARAAASAYGPALERGRFPAGALYLTLPLELVDVNVHPQKAEVRFAHARAVTDAVYSIVSAAIAAALEIPLTPKTHTVVPAFKLPDDTGEAWSWSAPAGGSAGERAHAAGGTPEPLRPASRPAPEAARPLPVAPAATRAPATAPRAEQAAGVRRFVALLRGRYLLFDEAARLLVVDGNRAKAVRSLRLLEAELERGQIVAQRLLFPVGVACDGARADAAEQASDALDRLGFELRRTGPGHVAAHTLPRLLSDGPAEVLVTEVLDALGRAATPPFGIDTPDLLRRLAEHTAGKSHPPAPSELDDEIIRAATVHELAYDDLS